MSGIKLSGSVSNTWLSCHILCILITKSSYTFIPWIECMVKINSEQFLAKCLFDNHKLAWRCCQIIPYWLWSHNIGMSKKFLKHITHCGFSECWYLSSIYLQNVHFMLPWLKTKKHWADHEVWEWKSNFIPHFLMDVTTYPCWDWISSMLVKGAPHNNMPW